MEENSFVFSNAYYKIRKFARRRAFPDATVVVEDVGPAFTFSFQIAVVVYDTVDIFFASRWYGCVDRRTMNWME